MELIDSLFPVGSIDAATALLNLRNNLANTIPTYLQQNGFSKLKKTRGEKKPFDSFIDYRQNIFLCYRKTDISSKTRKSRELKQKLISDLYEMHLHHPNYHVVYGYLIPTNNPDSRNPSELIVNNVTIEVKAGEALLRYLLEREDSSGAASLLGAEPRAGSLLGDSGFNRMIAHMRVQVNGLFESGTQSNETENPPVESSSS